MISAVVDLDPEPALNLPQMVVELPAEIGQPAVVGGFEDQIFGFGCNAQTTWFTSGGQRQWEIAR